MFSVKIVVICLAGLLAAVIDSISGGGGLIVLPAYMYIGLSPCVALGTNKLFGTFSSSTCCIRYAKSNKVDFKLIKFLIPFSFIGSMLGVNTVLLMDKKYLIPIVSVLILFVGVYTIFSKSMGVENNFKGITKSNLILGMIFALILGFYDGFFGPGSGSFAIFGLIKIFKFDFITASANGKMLNLTGNITALIIFALHNQINYPLGIIASIFGVCGACLGTKLALKNGTKLVKPIFVTMSLAVAGKLVLAQFY